MIKILQTIELHHSFLKSNVLSPIIVIMAIITESSITIHNSIIIKEINLTIMILITTNHRTVTIKITMVITKTHREHKDNIDKTIIVEETKIQMFMFNK
jgi:hypothetical protein